MSSIIVPEENSIIKFQQLIPGMEIYFPNRNKVYVVQAIDNEKQMVSLLAGEINNNTNFLDDRHFIHLQAQTKNKERYFAPKNKWKLPLNATVEEISQSEFNMARVELKKLDDTYFADVNDILKIQYSKVGSAESYDILELENGSDDIEVGIEAIDEKFLEKQQFFKAIAEYLTVKTKNNALLFEESSLKDYALIIEKKMKAIVEKQLPPYLLNGFKNIKCEFNNCQFQKNVILVTTTIDATNASDNGNYVETITVPFNFSFNPTFETVIKNITNQIDSMLTAKNNIETQLKTFDTLKIRPFLENIKTIITNNFIINNNTNKFIYNKEKQEKFFNIMNEIIMTTSEIKHWYQCLETNINSETIKENFRQLKAKRQFLEQKNWYTENFFSNYQVHKEAITKIEKKLQPLRFDIWPLVEKDIQRNNNIFNKIVNITIELKKIIPSKRPSFFKKIWIKWQYFFHKTFSSKFRENHQKFLTKVDNINNKITEITPLFINEEKAYLATIKPINRDILLLSENKVAAKKKENNLFPSDKLPEREIQALAEKYYLNPPDLMTNTLSFNAKK